MWISPFEPVMAGLIYPQPPVDNLWMIFELSTGKIWVIFIHRLSLWIPQANVDKSVDNFIDKYGRKQYFYG